MSSFFAGRRHARVALALLVFTMAAGAHAQDAPPSGHQPAAAPSGQKSGGRGAGTPASPAAAEQHRLPPDSTTKQTLVLPGRTLNFTATAGSIRLYDDKREPQADIAYTAYQLEGADARTGPSRSCSTAVRALPPPGCNWARPDPGGWPSAAMRRFRRRRPICNPTPRPGSTSAISSSSIPSAPDTAASSPPARMCASGSSRPAAMSTRSR